MSQTRKQKLKEDLQKQRRRRTITTTLIVAIAMIVIIVVIILINRPAPSNNQLIGQPIPQSMYAAFSGVSDNALNTAKGTANVLPLSGQTYTPALTTDSAKPTFLYIGAEYCPFCAAERWSMLVALSRFGNFTGVQYMLSSASDSPASVPTFSFRGASYSSPYVAFVSHEVQDRDRVQTSDQPTTTQKSIWDYFDSGEGIPFIDIGNSAGTHYVIGTSSPHSGSQFPPTILSGNWTQIATQLDIANSNIAMNVNSAADTIIHAICQLDGNNPSTVCNQSYALAPFPPSQAPPATDYLSSFLAIDRSSVKSWTG